MIPVRVDPKIKPHVVTRGRELGPDHPLGSHVCPICDEPLGTGPVALVFVGRYPDDPESWTAASVAIHDRCVAGSTEP